MGERSGCVPCDNLNVPSLLSFADYEALPDVPGYREELIEGERVLSPSAKKGHTIVIENIEAILRQQIGDTARVVRESGLRLESGTTVLEPDLMVLSKQDWESAASDDWFTGKPLFVVEVISPSERKSKRLRKVALYLDTGVFSVVEVDLIKRIVLVHTADADLPILIEAGRMEQPFEAELGQIFSRL